MTKSDPLGPKETGNPLPLNRDDLDDDPAEEIPLSLKLGFFCIDSTNKYSSWIQSLRQNATMSRVGHILRDLPIAKDLLLIFRPQMTWQRIADKPRSWLFVLIYYLMPLFLLVALVEGFGLVSLGHRQLAAGASLHPFTTSKVMAFEMIQWTLSLCLLITIAICIKSFANTHHARSRTGQALVLVFHAVGPFMLLQLLNGIPGMNLWVSWLLGISLVVGALYHGIPKILQPDVPSAMGIYLASAVTMVLLMFIGRLLTYGYLSGQLKVLVTIVSTVAEKIPLD